MTELIQTPAVAGTSWDAEQLSTGVNSQTLAQTNDASVVPGPSPAQYSSTARMQAPADVAAPLSSRGKIAINVFQKDTPSIN